jgi:hypothetical protein
VDDYRKPHRYDPDPRSTVSVPVCRCGMTRTYRSHQPLWWRVLFRRGEVAVSERERLGRLVRGAWMAWASEQPDPKPSWLTPWGELDDGQREVDMRIGEAVAAAERERIARLAEEHGAVYPTCPCGPGDPHPDGSPAPFADLIRDLA